jgi:hypothetical protein
MPDLPKGPGVSYEFEQVVRGMCGLPTARINEATPPEVRAIVAAIRQTGRRPVLLGPSAAFLAGFGGSAPEHILSLSFRGDAHTLIAPPVGTTSMHDDIWMSEFPK